MEHHMERQLHQNLDEVTLDDLLEGCQLISFDWRYLYVNNTIIKQSKCSKKEEMLGYTMMKKFPGIEKTEMFTALEECMKKRASKTITSQFPFPDNSMKWFELRIEPVPKGLFILSSDVTEQKKAENQFKLVVESVPNAIILSNQKGEITLVNAHTEKIFGYTREELINNSLKMLIPKKYKNKPDQRKGFYSNPTAKEIRDGRELYALKKDGTEFPIEIGLNSIKIGDEMLVLASIIDITNQMKMKKERDNRQHEILQVTIEAQEKERNEIGKELHDNVNQLLASIKMMLGLVVSNPNLKEDIISKCYKLTGECIQEIRKLTSSLVPDVDKSLIENIDHIIGPLEISKKIKFKTEISDKIVKQLNYKQQLTFYRITQEQVTNILKHSKAKNVAISLKHDKSNAVLTISDDGTGIKEGIKPNGIGMSNMKSRCQALNGSFEIISEPGEGCTVKAVIPLEAEQSNTLKLDDVSPQPVIRSYLVV